MKLVVTINDYCHVVNVGGSVQKDSVIITIPEENMPPELKSYIDNEQWKSLTFSILREKND